MRIALPAALPEGSRLAFDPPTEVVQFLSAGARATYAKRPGKTCEPEVLSPLAFSARAPTQQFVRC